MRLEFSYTWAEWVEESMACRGYSRRGQRAYQRQFLLPVGMFFLFSLGCLMLSYANRSGSLWRVMLNWLLTAMASLLGLILAYCFLMELLEQIEFRRTWQQAKHFQYKLDIDVAGLVFSSAKTNPKPEWFEISRYFETDSLFMLCNERKRLGVPKRLFHDEARQNEFLQLIECLITANQAMHSLAIDP